MRELFRSIVLSTDNCISWSEIFGFYFNQKLESDITLDESKADDGDLHPEDVEDNANDGIYRSIINYWPIKYGIVIKKRIFTAAAFYGTIHFIVIPWYMMIFIFCYDCKWIICTVYCISIFTSYTNLWIECGIIYSCIIYIIPFALYKSQWLSLKFHFLPHNLICSSCY